MTGKVPLTLALTINDAASAVDADVFVCPDGAEYEVAEVTEVHRVAGGDAGAVTLDITKSSSGTSPAGGTSVLSSTFNLKSTADTPVQKTAASGLSSSLATRTLRAGQKLGFNFTGTLTALKGLSVTIVLVMRRPGTRR